jgi:hypothetical protein
MTYHWPKVSVVCLALACQARDPAGSIPTARSAVPAASFAVASGRPSASAMSASTEAELTWSDELVAQASSWTAAHRSTLWKLTEGLSQRLSDIDDRGCGATLRPGERLGAALARQRREARSLNHYHRTGYECSIGFGLDGTRDDHDYTLSVSLRVRQDGSLLDSHVVCYLAG